MADSVGGWDGGDTNDDATARITEAALVLAKERDWGQISLLDIARASGMPLAEVYRRFQTKDRILAAFSRRVDEAVLEEEDTDGSADDMGEPARDRLFDVLMRRLDNLHPHREAIGRILRFYQRDPIAALGGLGQLRRSMACMLEAAGLSSSGLRGELRLSGLCVLYVATLRTWLDDETQDMAKTMAALDGYLRRVERPVAMAEGAWRSAASKARDESAPPPTGEPAN